MDNNWLNWIPEMLGVNPKMAPTGKMLTTPPGPGATPSPEMAPTGQYDWGDWYRRNFGYQGSFVDRLLSSPGSLVPPGGARTLVTAAGRAKDILEYPVRKATDYIGMTAPEASPDTPPTVDPNQAQMDSYVKILADATKLKQQTVNIPGAGTSPVPAPNLPAPPDFTAARQAFMQSRPSPIPRASEGETLASILGSAALGAGRGTTPGQILALAGGGAATARADTEAQNRKLTDTENERQRQFNRDLAAFEVNEAKTKFQAEWEKSVLLYKTAVENWKLQQPDVKLTENGAIVLSNDGKGGKNIQFVPWNGLATASIAGTNARKQNGGIGGQPFLAEFQATVRAAPPGGEKLAMAGLFVKNAIRSGGLIIPGGEQNDTQKAATLQNNAKYFGNIDSRPILEQAMRRATAITTSQGLTGGKEYHDVYMQNLYNILGSMIISKPEIFNRFATLTFGSNSGQ